MRKKWGLPIFMGISAKLVLPILMVIFMLTIPAFLALRGMQEVDARKEDMSSHTRSLVAIHQMRASLETELEELASVSQTTPEFVSRQLQRAANRSSRLSELDKNIEYEPEAGWIGELELLNDRYVSLLGSAAQGSPGDARASQIPAELAVLNVDMNDLYMNLAGSVELRGNNSAFASFEDIQQSGRSVLYTMVIAAVSGIGLAMLLTRRLVRPLRSLARAAGEFSNGQFDSRVTVTGDDELSGLGRSFNNMASSLQLRTEALVREQNKLQSVHKSITDGVLVLGNNGFIISANPAAEKILQKTESKLAGSRETGIGAVDELLGCHDLQEPEEVVVDVNGRSYSISVAPILNDQGETDGRLAVMHDLTEERYHAKQLNLLYEIVDTIASSESVTDSLQESLELCVSATDATSGSIMIVDEDESLIIAAQIGLPAEVKGHRQHLGEGIAGWVAESGEPLLLTQNDPDVRFPGVRKITDAVCVPIRDQNGVIGVLSLNERKSEGGFTRQSLDFLAPVTVQMGTALSRAKLHERIVAEMQKSTAIVECMGESLCVRSADRTIVFANQAHKNIFGDDCTGKTCHDLYVGRDQICRACPLDRCFESGDTVRRTHFVLDRLGNRRQLETTASPIRDADGKIVNCIEVSRDVTEMLQIRGQAESRLRSLTTLFQVSNTLSSGLELKSILQNFTSSAQEAFRASHVSVMLLNNDSRLVVKAVSGETAGWPATLGQALDLTPMGIDNLVSGAVPFCVGAAAQMTPVSRSLAPPGSESLLVGRLSSRGKLLGLLCVASPRRNSFSDDGQQDLFMDMTNQAAVAIDNAEMFERLQETFWTTIRSLAEAIDAKDSYTRGHSDRVAEYAEALANRLMLDDDEINAVRCAGYLHDTGKIGIPDAILLKPGRLTEEEYAVIMNHPIMSHRIIEPVEFPFDVKPIVRHHHERMDGAGYPDGLTGHQIPLGARIVSIADAFEAMISDRPYRKALSVQAAAEELRRCAGTQFDAELVDEFLIYLNEDEGIRYISCAS